MRARVLDSPIAIAVSRDGKSVYVAAGEGARAPTAGIAIFSSNANTGALTQPATADGCIDGQFATTPGCAYVPLENPFTIVVSGDGRNVYVGDIYGLTAFARTAGTGALRSFGRRLSCDDDVGRVCTHARLLAVGSIALSPNGRSLYATSENKYALGVFARTTQSGELRQLPGPDGCFSESGSRGACRDGKALLGPGAVTVSHDGLNVYVTSGENNGAIAVFARRR
jgi:DNA-binding beta-propeller fold protein YncE